MCRMSVRTARRPAKVFRPSRPCVTTGRRVPTRTFLRSGSPCLDCEGGLMVVTCSHCFCRVIPLPQNICPSCLTSLSDGSDAEPVKVSMVVREASGRPAHCYLCASPTTRYVSVRRSMKGDGDGPLVRLLTLVFSWPLFLLTFKPSTRRSFEVHLPQCSECGARERPEPLHVDFERFEMTFVVSRVFRHRAAER